MNSRKIIEHKKIKKEYYIKIMKKINGKLNSEKRKESEKKSRKERL